MTFCEQKLLHVGFEATAIEAPSTTTDFDAHSYQEEIDAFYKLYKLLSVTSLPQNRLNFLNSTIIGETIRRLTQTQISRMRAFRKQGYSYKEIANFFQMSKSLAYYRTKDVSVSSAGRRRLRLKIESNWIKFARSHIKPVRIFTERSPARVRVIAHVLGDGTVRVDRKRKEYLVEYYNKCKPLVLNWIKDVKSVYGVKPKLRLKKGRVYAAYVCNKEVVMDFFQFKNSKNWRVPNWVRNKPRLLKEFIRALADDEGTAYVKGRYGRVSISSNSLVGLKDVQKCLEMISVESKIYGPYEYNYILAIRSQSLFQYFKHVGFSHPKKAKKLKLFFTLYKMVRE